jgi:serine/threonine protein kinase
MSALKQGDRISNYILDERCGAGSFGEVWRARHHVLGDTVAVKVPTDPQYVKNLQREGVTIHGLKHPNVVRVIDLDPYADPPYLVMEYVDGPSLRDAINSLRAAFPITAAVAIMRGLLQALGVAHQNGIIHRDIKPANILLAHPLAHLATIADSAVKVVDFGLGHVGGMTTRSIMQSVSREADDPRHLAGTIAYMSPEQREGKPIDARSDLYSCGVVLFEMLTGERPAGGEVPSSLRASVPPHLDRVFRQCYVRWDRRFASAQEMLMALDPSLATGSSARAPIGHSKLCPQCALPVERGDNFCIHCGQSLVESVPRCRHCGAFVQVQDRYCILCGKNLTVLA